MAGPAAADVKAGVDAWSRGDYARAIAEWQGPAERGDPDAQFNMGQAYKLGRGVPVDLARAEELFGKAAARGHLQAADNYGLLLFQRGEHTRAMPYVKAAAGRGDPRSQYLLGIAHFNGDNVEKDWVRAYALVGLAQQAGLPQASTARAQMDKYIPLQQRQQSVALASELAGAAQQARESQLAAFDLDATVPSPHSTPPASARAAHTARAPQAVSPESAAATAERAAESPRTAGADYARPRTPEVVTLPKSKPPAPAAAPAPVSPSASSGAWRVQLGAFGVAANAEALWSRVKARPELAGRSKLLVPTGKVTKLQAGGFASEAEARAACSRLAAAGFACIAARN